MTSSQQLTPRGSRRPSLIPVEDDIWQASNGANGPVRAVKACVDSRRPRMLLKDTLPRGPSLTNDIAGIAKLLDENTPACILISLADDVQTLGAKETDRILLLYLPAETPKAAEPTWRSGAASMEIKVPGGRVTTIEISDKDDVTAEFIITHGKEMIDKAGSEAAPRKNVDKKTIHTTDDVVLPSFRLNAAADAETPLFVFGHGLGQRLADFCNTHIGPALEVDLQQTIEGLPQSAIVKPSLVLYDARGHGEATGWEKRGPHQFHWRALGYDMLQVAAAHRNHNEPPFILGGCSMGAATAVWAALLNPNAVKGLVLYMAPTMWETRKARRAALEAAAKEQDEIRSEVKLGAARCDMPSKEELEVLAAMKLPVLIVNCRDDPVHPASSAELLKDALGPKVTLTLVDKREELAKAFTDALAKWLPTLSAARLSVRPSTRTSTRPA